MTRKSTPDAAPENAAATTNSAEPQETAHAEKSLAKSSPKAPLKPAATAKARSPVSKAVSGAAAKAAKPAVAKAGEKAVVKSARSVKPKKDKLVRDSFTMPESEYNLLAAMKKRCLVNGVAVKKSELIRAAIIGFADQSDAALTGAVQTLTIIKTGRPKAQK